MKRWTLLLLFFASSVSANSWLDTRADYYPAAKLKLGYTTTSTSPFTDSMGWYYFNEAATVILPINRGIKRLTTLATSYHQNTYGLDSTLTDIEAVWLKSGGRLKPLKYLPVTNWNDQQHIVSAGKNTWALTRPSYYDYTDSLLLIFPVPAQHRVDTLTIMGWHRLPDVEGATTPTVIPEMYRVAILYHMVWNHAKARSDPRAEGFKEELSLALNRVGLKLTSGGQVVEKAGN